VEVLLELWGRRGGVLSTQVLQEFYVNVARKISSRLPKSTARDIVERYSVWPIVTIDPELILRGSRIEEKHQLSFWDSLIIAAAQKVNATKLLSEDLNPGQAIGGVQVENPLND
jgi:predicted nucleic acid-binding protein